MYGISIMAIIIINYLIIIIFYELKIEFRKPLFTRTKFIFCKGKLLNILANLKISKSSRKISFTPRSCKQYFRAQTQGHSRWPCKKNYVRNECICRSASRICSSKYYASLSCKNIKEQ